MFQEYYDEALKALQRACQLDPNCEPGKLKIDRTQKFIQNISKLVAGKVSGVLVTMVTLAPPIRDVSRQRDWQH